MLQAIRDGSKGLVAKIIVGLIIVTFALFGIESIVALGGGEDAPAVVNGEEISEFKVQQSIQMQKRNLQAQLGENFDPNIFKDELMREASVEALIKEAVVVQAAKDAGIAFSQAAIDEMIVKSPDFQVNGQFDRDQFDLVLRSAGFTRLTYRDLLRTSLLTQQLQNSWQSTSFATPYEMSNTAKLEAQTRDFAVTTFSLEEMKKTIEISDEEVAAHYETNSENYMTSEKVSVKYVELNADDLAKAVQITEDEVLDQYEVLKAESNSAKEYRAAHILLLETDQAAQDKLAEVQGKLASGQSFEELAKEYSEDDTSKFSGGDLGFASEDIYEEEFANALISLNKGDVSPVVETRDGLHLIKLLDVRQPEVAKFEEMKDSIEEGLRKEAIQVVYIEALERLKEEAFSSTGIEPVAASLELSVKSEGPFSQAGGKGIASNREVITTAFSDSVLNEGVNSEVIELSDKRAVVIHLDEFFESKPKPLDEVRNQIVQQLTEQKALDKLTEEAQMAHSKAMENGKFDANWKTYESKTRKFSGVNQSVVNSVFAMGLPEEKSSFSVVDLSNGDKALVRLDAINRDVKAEVGESQSQQVSRIKAQNEFKAFYEYNLASADIEKN